MRKLVLEILAAAALAACAERAWPAQESRESADTVQEAEAPRSMAGPGDDAVALEEGEGLLGRVRVSDGEARVVALRNVPGGRIVRATLEERDGRLVYVYEVVAEAHPGMITEVLVNALTGEVVSVTRVKAGTEAK